MKTLLRIAAALAALVITTSLVEAKTHRHHHRSHQIVYDAGTILSHPEGCPHSAFCGCGVCVKLGYSASECKRMGLWKASSYYRYPKTSLAAGTVAIFGYHHVAYVEAIDANGNAVLYDPNSGGHRTRRWTRDVSGATIVQPHGGLVEKTRNRRTHIAGPSGVWTPPTYY